LPSDGVDSAPSRQVRSIRLDFLGPWPLRREAPPFIAVGLSWISLDSLVRIKTYQWVTRHKAGKSFSRRFSRGVERRRNGSPRSRPCGGAELLMGQSLASDFPQQIIVRTFCLSPASIQKQRALGSKANRRWVVTAWGRGRSTAEGRAIVSEGRMLSLVPTK